MQVVGISALESPVLNVVNRAWSPEIAEWLRRSLPRHLRRDVDLLRQVRSRAQLEDAMRADKLAKDVQARIASDFSASAEVFQPNMTRITAFLEKVSDMVDWLTALPEEARHRRRIERMSIPEALAMSEAWHARLAEQISRTATSSEGVRVEEVWPDGTRMVELRSPVALGNEGNAMGHCVGGYWNQVNSGLCRIFSLRDKDDFSHVTIEIGQPPSVRTASGEVLPLARRPRDGVDRVAFALNGGVVGQVRGKGNRPPVSRWSAYVAPFLSSRGWSDQVVESDKSMVVYSLSGKHFQRPEDAIASIGPIGTRQISRGKSILRSLPNGISGVLDASSPEVRLSFDALLDRLARKKDAGRTEVDAVLRVVDTAIDVACHRLPLGSMELVATGGADVAPFERVRRGLETFLDEVEANPDRIHAFDLPVGNGVTAKMVSDMFLACGLAARREDAKGRNREGIERRLREARDRLRVEDRARRQGRSNGALTAEDANRLSNLLAGDAYPRLLRMALSRIGAAEPFLPDIKVPDRKVAPLPPRESVQLGGRTAQRLLGRAGR